MNHLRAAGLLAGGLATALLGLGCAPEAASVSTADLRDASEPAIFRPDPVRPATHITVEPVETHTGPQVILMPIPGRASRETGVERLPPVPDEEKPSPLPPLIDAKPADPPSYVPAAVPAPPPPLPPKIEKPAPAAPAPAAAPQAPAQPAAPPAPTAAAAPETKPAAISPNRAALLAGVGRQVRELTEHANTLAQRGAFFAARAEYFRALRLAAQALDTLDSTGEHSRALTAGLRAVKESADFAKLGPADVEPDLENIVGGHRTPILRDAKLKDLSAAAALNRYLTFAQRQLAAAVQGVPEASLALYGLGRIEPLMNDRAEEQSLSSLNGPRSIAWHQAALLVDDRNYRAANELAVWLARYGQHTQARQLLVRSLQVKRMPEAWHNLAVVHEHLGQNDLASLARRELALTKPQSPAAGRETVEWLEADQFAKRSGPTTTR